MSAPGVHDLTALDRAVRAAWEAARAAVRDGASVEEALAAHRAVSGKRAYDALLAMPEGRDRALAVALARHVGALTIARVSGGAAHEVTLARRARAVPAPDRVPRLAPGPRDARVSHEEAIHEALYAKDLEARGAWLDLAARAGASALDAERRLREVRAEARARLGAPDDGDDTRDGARAFLERTQDLARAMVREGAKAEPSPGALLDVALARGAGDGWPRAPVLGAIVEAFGPAARREVSAVARHATLRPVAPLGAASWARAYARFAFSAHANARSPVPYAVRLGPERFAAHRTALLVAACVAEPSFHARALGCAARVAQGQARALALSGLLAARASAASVCDLEPRQREELLFFGARDGALGALVPRPRDDAKARFRAWLALAVDLPTIAERHDEDWFRNPRFWVEVAVRVGSAELGLEGDARAHASALAAAFERRIA